VAEKGGGRREGKEREVEERGGLYSFTLFDSL